MEPFAIIVNHVLYYCTVYFATLFPALKAGHSRTIVMRVVSIEALRKVGRDKSCWVDARHINAEPVVTGHCHQEYLRKPKKTENLCFERPQSISKVLAIPACSVAGTTEITWFSETVKLTPEICTKTSVKRSSSQTQIVRGPTFLELKRLILRPSNMHRNLKPVRQDWDTASCWRQKASYNKMLHGK